VLVEAHVFVLKALPQHSGLKFLGYFGILESLLTHPPKPSDPCDSSTRQVRTKIALLDNRFNQKIDYSDFSGASAQTVWTKMFAIEGNKNARRRFAMVTRT
jgi:hypothetical protein